MNLINDLIEKMIHPITGLETTLRMEQMRMAKLKTNKERKKKRGFVPSVHKKEPLK